MGRAVGEPIVATRCRHGRIVSGPTRRVRPSGLRAWPTGDTARAGCATLLRSGHGSGTGRPSTPVGACADRMRAAVRRVKRGSAPLTPPANFSAENYMTLVEDRLTLWHVRNIIKHLVFRIIGNLKGF